MNKTLIASCLLAAAVGLPALANAADAMFYVAQDAKTKACSVSDKKPDGKMMMDVGTKAYTSQANANSAMANLKACMAAAAPAAAPKATTAMKPATPAMTKPAMAKGFYVAQDAKTKKCMVSDKKPDGKMMMDVGTKMYDTEGNAKDAMSKLTACKA